MYGDGLPDEMQTSMEKLSRALWNWKRVVWVDDILTISNCYRKLSDDLLASLRGRIGVDDANEIWTCKLINPLEKVAVDAWPDIPIILYEDGLHIFVPQKTCSRGFNGSYLFHPLKMSKYIISGLMHDRRMLRYTIKGVWSDHLDRLKRMHLFLSGRLETPEYLRSVPVTRILADSILSTLDDVKSSREFQGVLIKRTGDGDRKSVLVLAQNFSKGDRQLKREDELACYRQVAVRLIAHGYHVYWKEHPRTEEKFYLPILGELDADQSEKFIELDIPFTWPVELFVGDLNIIGCVSCTSTALFHLPELFHTPTYTIIDYFGKFKTKDFRVMSDIVRKRIPPLEVLFDINGK